MAFPLSDLTPFKSPLAGKGTEHFKTFCEKHELDFQDLLPKMTAYFAGFPAMIHVQAADRHANYTWWTWLHLCPQG